MTRKRICLILAGMLLFCTVLPANAADAPMESTLPERYLGPCPEQGTVTSHFYKDKEELKVWTPYGYSGQRVYEIVLLMHGDYGSLNSWLTNEYTLFGHTVEGRYVFDWMAYEKRTVPFIVVTLNNKPFEQETMVRDITDALLFVADNYSVYPGGTVASLVRNRDHITVGGLSRGSMLTHWFLSICPEYAANYICMSAAGPYTEIPDALERKHVRMKKLFSAAGAADAEYHDMTVESYEYLKPYADESLYLEYRYGHTWHVWLPGVYEALLFVLPQDSAEYEILCAVRTRLCNQTVPFPRLIYREIRNR
ncbi:MAG: hypothetical protein II049_05165 [Clostridia bacterium]|nr:hypothetical protein [Clostridia bacterium]